jgi:hypothetical protein
MQHSRSVNNQGPPQEPAAASTTADLLRGLETAQRPCRSPDERSDIRGAWCSTGAPGCPGLFFAAQFHFDARAARNGAALNVLRGDQILDGYTHRLVVGDLLV